MPRKRRPISPELWLRAEALFEKLEESSDPEALLRAEPDAELAELVRRLWEGSRNAGGPGFLDKTLTVVRELAGSPEARFQAGQKLAGRFRVEGPLGAGGMGEVYLAYDGVLHEKVALKTIRRDMALDPAIARRFLAEVRNARRVTHAHVCRINDIFDEGGIPFFTMKYLEGVRLSDWLGSDGGAAAGVGERVRRRIALELAEGLAAAHRANIIHCDFKPSNVILTGPAGNPSAMITDFGLARAFGPTGQFGEKASGPAAGGGEGGSATTAETAPSGPAGDATESGAASRTLKGGTHGYMAPELQAGAPASVRTDIYSYGKVLGELLPGHRLAGQCAAERPEERPDSLDAVVRALGGGMTRRLWLAGGAAAAAGVAAGSYALLSRPRFVLASRQRVAVNGFRPGGQRAFVLRNLVVTALRQSPLLMVMADDRLRALLRMLKYKPQLPAETTGLLALAAREGALAIEGAVEASGGGLRLLLQVFPQGENRPALQIAEEVDDGRQVVKLADRMALRLRRELGESAGSLRTGYRPLEQVTSASPEAVELYYRGLEEYNQAHARDALTWFDQALRIDPNFVMAIMQFGIALASQDELASALPYYERAFALRNRVSERERLWIEGRYYNITWDYVSSLATCRRLVVLFPEEATFQRNVAFAATRVGRPQDALPFCQRSLELDPDNESGRLEWLVDHCDANLYDEALAKHRQFRDDGDTNSLLDYAAGVAYTGKGEFENAVAAFVRMGAAPERERYARLKRSIPLIASGHWAEVASELASEIAYDSAVSEELRQMSRRYWLGMMQVWIDKPWEAVPQAEILCRLDATPAWFECLREGSMLALESGQTALAGQALERLREIERRWPSTDSHGSRALLEGLVVASFDVERARGLMAEAFGLWPDPITLYAVGRFRSQHEDLTGALAALEVLEEARGRAYRLFFPGLVALGRIERARVLARMSRFEESGRLYKRVLEDWGGRVSGYALGKQVRSEYTKLISMQTQVQGERHD